MSWVLVQVPVATIWVRINIHDVSGLENEDNDFSNHEIHMNNIID
jgi:hypothetical protein